MSFAQNGEDVVLWRALGHLKTGRYLEVGANDPTDDSISKLFYDHGWSGVTVEPVPEYARRQREQRPRDTQVEAAVAEGEPGTIQLHVFSGTGLSTLDDSIAGGHERGGRAVEEIDVPKVPLQQIVEEHLAGEEVQFCVIDVEGLEGSVLRSVDLRRFRPWILVVESTLPTSTTSSQAAWEPMVLEAGYQFCLFDGLSRFYVADEHAEEFADKLSYPASILDNWARRELVERVADIADLQGQLARARAEIDEVTQQVLYWRGEVVRHWSQLVGAGSLVNVENPDSHAARELAAIQRTVSWRVTAPLRAVRRYAPGRP